MAKQYDLPHEYEIPVVDELAICIALIVGAKYRAQKHISNPFTDTSWLDEPEQGLMDTASDALDTAVQALEAVRQAIAKPPSP
ncbi:hypothetical protein QUB70_28180 [Microcoleus sp. A003_D6]|uniref:hypothetical protein n=1 Tax=Microcoleus sp. A003_D6 TaxID=3055266 RepID=UPI002FCF3504